MLSTSVIPGKLQNIPSPPKTLYIIGSSLENLLSRPCLTVVGSRKITSYGKAVTSKLAGDAARAGAVIVSGLAIGVDSIAHRAALEAGGFTIAVLPCGLDDVYPGSHRALARQIVEQGGALISEYPPGTTPYPGNFIARNRIASGLGDAVLITEASHKSGTLHTARFALEQGREVLAVPGNITSPTSSGTNNLIRSGATPVTCSEDLLLALGIERQAVAVPAGANPQEQLILDLIHAGTDDGEALLSQSKLETTQFNQALTMLEISGKIRPLGANKWSLQ